MAKVIKPCKDTTDTNSRTLAKQHQQLREEIYRLTADLHHVEDKLKKALVNENLSQLLIIKPAALRNLLK